MLVGALVLPAAASAGGAETLVSVSGGELQVQGQTPPLDVEIDYLPGTGPGDDEWQVREASAIAFGASCAAAGAGVVECPYNDENVDLSFGGGGGVATLQPADVQINFNSEIRLGPASDTVVASDGTDAVTAA